MTLGRLFAAALLVLSGYVVVDTLATDRSVLWLAIGGVSVAISVAVAVAELRRRG